MGIIVVLIFYAIFLSVLAVISGAMLFVGTKWYLRKTPHRAKKPLILAAIFPFACIMFAAVVCWIRSYQ